MKKSRLLIIVVALVGLVVSGVWCWQQNKKNYIQYSQMWMNHAMDIVKDKKPTPPSSARFYAYVSTVYYEVLSKTDSQDQANLATAEIVNVLYPEFSVPTNQILEKFKVSTKELSSDSRNIVDSYKSRISEDRLIQGGMERPVGEEYWVGENPLEPLAGTWKRWIVSGENFNVPNPPVYGSYEYKEALEIVKNSMNLTDEQAKAIKFWGGGPGTEAPAGIWQNRLHTMTQDLQLTDERYAYMQMILAQSLSDAFMECWKVKYVHWTKRPSMSDPAIDLIWMANPNFPSYVSGHSVISFTAASVLSALLPEYKEIWHKDAEEAKNSRLWAGIHFLHDVEEGKKLGEKIGSVIVGKL